MKSTELFKIIGFSESITVEWKESLSDMKGIIKSISAFSNTEGGKIIVGVSEKDGSPVGVQIGKGTIENFANVVSQHTDPKVHPRITVRKIEGKDIVIIEVKQSSHPPILADGIPYARVGSSSLKMSKDDHESLILEKHKEKLQFDKQICNEANLNDIDWGFVKKEFIPLYEESTGKKITGTPKAVLGSLGCIKNNKPTNAGILLFGNNPQEFFMNAYVALARYGSEDVDVKRLDYKEFTGNLFQQIDNSSKYIKENISVMSQLREGRVRREDIPEYGWFSIRELVTNAVCHRDYSNFGTKVIIKMFSNRIEFYNPGGLSKDVTSKNIAEMQFSRNPIIAKILAKVEYIEELGEGWNKILKEHKGHPLKPRIPTVKTDNYVFLVNIYSTKNKFVVKKRPVGLIAGEGLNERQKKALEYLKAKGQITRSIYCNMNDIGVTYAKKELNYLIQNKIIRRAGKGKKTHYFLVTE